MINHGIKNIIIATLFFGLINIMVKFYSSIPAVEIVFFRSVVTLVLSYIALVHAKVPLFNKHYKLLFLRGLFGAIALYLYFSTIHLMPLGSAVTILYLAPIFTVILAVPINREYVKKKQWAFIILGFLGALLIKASNAAAISYGHFFMGVSAAFFAGLAYNIIRKLKNRAHHQLIIFYFPLVTIPLTLPMVIREWVTPSLTELLGLIAIGVCTQIAQVFMTKAYMLEKASKISHFNYLTAFYAFVTGYFFFDESLSILSIIGAMLILISVLYSSKQS